MLTAGWILLALLAVIIGLYPSLYFFPGENFGLLKSKPEVLTHNIIWRACFYAHIIPGGLALLIGWIQFSKKLRDRYLAFHRMTGKIYITAVLISSLAGIYVGFYATGGLISALGFITLGVTWFTTTLLAYITIRQGKVEQHRRLMIYSYAACTAAVTLRIWLPLLATQLHDFILAYRIVAWLCWVPNLFVAWLLQPRN